MFDCPLQRLFFAPFLYSLRCGRATDVHHMRQDRIRTDWAVYDALPMTMPF